MSWLSGWTYRKAITIDHTKIDSDLTDFPVLVKLTIDNFDFSKAQSNGNDIRFTSSDGETLLKYERERHDNTNSKAEYWVKVPSVSSSADTTFYIYYGNDSASDGADPENVWDSNFKGVWHLNQDPSGAAPQELDSTANGNNGTSNGSMTSDDLVEGKIGKALDLDGSDDYIDVGMTSFGPTAMSVSAWFKSSLSDSYGVIVGRLNSSWDASSNGDFHVVLLTDGNMYFTLQVGGATKDLQTSGLSLNDNNPHLVYAVWDGSNQYIYVDREQKVTQSASGDFSASSNKIFIGKREFSSSPHPFLGIIDETRISNIARSAAYIKASYNSENDSLLTFSGLEVADLFDGKLVIIDSDTVDGKIDIKDTTSVSLDGKIALDEPTDYFDGLIDIKDSVSKTLDGVIDVKDTSILVSDGKAIIRSASMNLLDGMVHPVYSTINLLDGKVEVVYIVQNLLDGKVAPTDRLGNVDAFTPLPSTVFKLGGQVIDSIPCVDSTFLGVFRYARMQANLFPFSFQAFTGSIINENVPGFISDIIGTNPQVGIINGYLEPLDGIFRIGAGIESKVDLYGCEIYADTANVSKLNGFIPGVISLSLGDSEDVARILGSIVSPNGSFSGIIGNVGKVYGRIPYLLQVIEAKPGIISSIIGEASSLGATITASRSGDIIVISNVPGIKWHSLVDNGIQCVILKYHRGL